MSVVQQRRQEEKEARHESIIDAAEAVFSARGFEGATMADIAQQARLSRALVYVYFKDKEELLVAITLRGLQLLRRSFERAVAKADTGLAKIEAIGRAYIEFGRTQPDYFQPIARAETKATTANSELGEACEREGTKLCRITADALRIGIEDGSIDPAIGDPDAYAIVLWGLVHGVVQVATAKACALEKSHGFEIDEIADKAIALIQRGLARR
jgi:AcrR family transcriptional regulator